MKGFYLRQSKPECSNIYVVGKYVNDLAGVDGVTKRNSLTLPEIREENDCFPVSGHVKKIEKQSIFNQRLIFYTQKI